MFAALPASTGSTAPSNRAVGRDGSRRTWRCGLSREEPSGSSSRSAHSGFRDPTSPHAAERTGYAGLVPRPWTRPSKVARPASSLVLGWRAELRPSSCSLDVWSAESPRAMTITRPLRGGNMTCFSLRTLGPGRHEWALRAGGEVIATGTFVNPCPVSLVSETRRWPRTRGSYCRPCARHAPNEMCRLRGLDAGHPISRGSS
jgi:hypothetical protein